MRVNTGRLQGVQAALLPLVAAILGMAPGAASAQGLEAKAVHSRLLPLAGAADFAATVARESAALVSLEDAAWLNGALAAAAKNASQKKALLTERASLLELLGKYGDAAAAWESAASALPGPADAACLVSAAVCRLAAGDAELAAGLASAVGFLSPDARTARLASLVTGWAALARGERQVAAGIARTVLSGADPRFVLAALLLGRESADGAEREEYERLLSAYAGRPEAASTVPLLLLGGSTTSGASVREEIVQPVPALQPEMSFYQVGAFRDEANARLLVKKLETLKLEPRISYKSARELYIVYVPAGSDSSRTVLILKDAGYEAWAMDGAPP